MSGPVRIPRKYYDQFPTKDDIAELIKKGKFGLGSATTGGEAKKGFELPPYNFGDKFKEGFELPPSDIGDEIKRGFELPAEFIAPASLRDERSPLVNASYHGDISRVEALLKGEKVATTLFTALMAASSGGHVEVANLLIKYGAKVNMKHLDGMSPLTVASHAGHYDVAKLLLENGAKPNIQDQDNRTALIIACFYGYYDLVKLLLEHNAQPNIQDFYGISALMAASYNGHYEVAELLLKYNARPDIQNIDGMSALMFASYRGHHDVVELLLKYNAQLDMHNNNGFSSLLLACTQQHYATAKLLLGSPEIQLNHALLTASSLGHYSMVKLLLDNGALIDFQANKGETSLMLAGFGGHYEVVYLLLEKGAKVNIISQKGSALLYACVRGHYEVMKLLIEKGADVDAQTVEGDTALIIASYNRHLNITKLLLKKGAQVNICAKDSIFALWMAAVRGSYTITKLLLKKGARISMQDNYGGSALMAACVGGHYEVASLLLDNGAEPDLQSTNGGSSLTASSEKGHIDIVELLLENNAKVNQLDSSGLSALMLAKTYEIAKLLLDNGAQPNIQSANGETALMLAILNGHYDMCKLLLKRGARVEIQDFLGRSSLLLASYSGRYEIVRLLLEHGAKVNIQDNDGFSAFIHACTVGDYDTAKLLLEKGAKVDMQTSEGKTALMQSCQRGYYMTAKLLLDHGAQPNLQERNGFSSLHNAMMSGKEKLIKLLLSRGAQPNMRTNDGDNALTLACLFVKRVEIIDLLMQTVKVDKADLLRALQNAVYCKNSAVVRYLLEKCLAIIGQIFCLNTDSIFPGVCFYNAGIQKWITPEEATVDSTGISIFVPKGTLNEDESTDILIRPCFSGPFELPSGYESASPTYLIHPRRRARIQKDVTIRMHHYADLQTEQDCEDMLFVSASPESLSSPAYRFKPITGTRGSFRPKSSLGQITLQHFCFIKIARWISRRRRGNVNCYSARLYRNLSPNAFSDDVSAVFCMCLDHPIYIEHCDSRMRSYHAISKEEEVAALSVIRGTMVSDEITIRAVPSAGWKVSFDKKPTKILKRDLDSPEVFSSIPISQLRDYPPKFAVFVRQTSESVHENSDLPELQVMGLDMKEDCCFKLVTPIRRRSSSLASSVQSSNQSQCSENNASPCKSTGGSEESGKKTESTLTHRNVLTALVDITNKWRNLGMALDIKHPTIEKIGADHSSDVTRCLEEVISAWLGGRKDQLSWRFLCDALRSKLVERHTIADDIEQKYVLCSD